VKIKSIAKFQEKTTLLFISFFCIVSCSEASNQQIVLMENNNMPIATISTSAGEIKIELDKENAPISVDNFISLANSGYYTDTIFHRIIEGFMIQGGGLDADMQNKPSESAAIKNEANNGLKNDRGTIAMARTMDPHSATSQFFINHADNDFLNFSSETTQGWGYAVFGKVIEGMEVVDSIALSPTMVVNGYQDAPASPVTINSVSISE
jgi:peptidyl-prolyl cis-trans isomerase B (cyclophilin B)